MSSIEKDFLARALELGLAETIARTIQDLDRVIAEYPAGGGERYLKRLHEQRRSLVAPSLRTIAALVVSMCAQDRLRARLIAPTFGPDMARFYERLDVKRRSKLTPDRRPILTPLASVPGPAARRVAVS